MPVTPPVIPFCNPLLFFFVLFPASRSHGGHGHLAIGHVGGDALAVRLHLHHLHHHLHVLAGHAHHAHQATVSLPLRFHLRLPVRPSLFHLSHLLLAHHARHHISPSLLHLGHLLLGGRLHDLPHHVVHHLLGGRVSHEFLDHLLHLPAGHELHR